MLCAMNLPARMIWGVLRPLMRLYWRLTRPVTLGVRGMVFDAEGRVLLVRHSYIPGWYLPGGGVSRGETMRSGLDRELQEEVGVTLRSPARFHAIYANFREFKSDHVGLFVVESGTYDRTPQKSAEISEARFFGLAELPVDISPSTALRISEVVENRESPDSW